MDGPTLEHSDSDSGESWTLLDHSPAYADDAPEFPDNNAPREPPTSEANVEKDEDTDGISVISDSEPDSPPCEISFEHDHLQENRPVDHSNPHIISLNPLPSNISRHHESIRSDDDLLGDHTGKHKTYVHRRNKRLSTVLNIIMLGSVITAAGVAIGHMWGARYDCTMHTTSSVNKILSNLYKLQEENAYLRNKLKELTLVSGVQLQQRKLSTEKVPFKQQRCKKVYEEPLSNKNADKVTKCIDDNENPEIFLENHLAQPQVEKDFINDIQKLKNIYKQNRSWLDDEIAKRMKNEEILFKKMTSNMKSPLTSIMEEQRGFQDDIVKEQSHTMEMNAMGNIENHITNNSDNDGKSRPLPLQERKITYADSLKSDLKPHKIEKRETNIFIEKEFKDHFGKRKSKKDNEVINVVLSEEELKKDDRYVGQKFKQEKKKRDRQKLHKKQKRKNKYEQWEMKGGYLKDFDEFSISSSQENEWKHPDKNYLSRDFEKNNYINQFSEADTMKKQKSEIENSKSDKHTIKPDKVSAKNIKNEELNWFDKRAVLRNEARKRLEHELFGETSPNNAGWYFRRMQRREQCRAKADNSTYKKFSKRNMNFKTKH